ncbi:MAG: hypothetical protein OXE99_15410 [Cellvibrionales bacterium]|nr:hypothetical protein [Cellvibrionales bacterium]
MKRLHPVFLSLIALFGLTSCLDQIKLSPYSIEYPQNGASYIGTYYEPAENDDGSSKYNKLDREFVINYTSPPSGPLKIVLNGNDIGEYFVQGASQAKADIQDIKQFFKQGRNTFSVELLSLGPQIVFNLDAAGPDIIITSGASSDGGVTVDIEGYLRDASSYGSTIDVELTAITGHDANGNVITRPEGSTQIDVNPDGTFFGNVNIDGIIVPEQWENISTDPDPDTYPVWRYREGVSLLYTLRAEDEHGYDSKVDILADVDGSGDSLPINNALRIAIGDSFIESLRPVIAAGIYSALETSPISGSNLGPFKVDIGLGNMPTYVDYFHLASGKELDPDYEKPEDSPGEVDWSDINGGAGPGKATVLLNGFEIRPDSVIAVDMIITNVLAELTIELPSWISWLISELKLGMFIERIDVETGAKAQAAEGKVDVQLVDSNFSLQGIQTTQVQAGILDITALAGALIPLLEGLIGDLLPTLVNPVISDNLSRIVIGQRIYRTDLIPSDIDKDNLPSPTATDLTAEEQVILDRLEAEVPHTDFRVDVFELGTGNLLGPNAPYDLKVGIQSKADTAKRDDNVKPILGTYFNDDPINPNLIYNSLGNQGTNISMAVNSNLLNQFLGGLYSIGQMHLTLHDGKTYFGADYDLTPVDPENPTQTLAKKGDTRIRLWPDMPPIFKMEEIVGSGGVGKASITYPSARLAIEAYDGSNWSTDIELEVDFDLAILVDELDGAVTLGAAGPPVFNVNRIINNTNIQVPEIAVQMVLDAALFFGGDAIADQVIPIDLNTIAEGLINGTQVEFLSADDNFTLAKADGETIGECAIEYAEDQWGKCPIGDTSCNPADFPLANSGDGEPDTICEVLNFVVQTDTVGTTGIKGSNLFFQMGARDPDIPPPPAIPRLDLDDDGIIDYRDNCAISQYELSQVINTLEGNGFPLSDAMLTEINDKGEEVQTGEIDPAYESRVKEEANKLMAIKLSASGSPNADPTLVDAAWYNQMRRNTDDNVAFSDLGDYPWLRMLFANESQLNTDGDRIGELCEDDADRDGVYADNVPPEILKSFPEQVKYWVDNCPDTQQLDAFGQPWNITEDNAMSLDGYYATTETDPDSVAGDACDIRKQFVTIKIHELVGGQCVGTNTQFVDCMVNGRVNDAAKWYMNKENDPDIVDGDYYRFFTHDADRLNPGVDPVNGCLLAYEGGAETSGADLWLRGGNGCNKTGTGGDKSRWRMKREDLTGAGNNNGVTTPSTATLLQDAAAPFTIGDLKGKDGNASQPRCFYKNGNNVWGGTGCARNNANDRWGILVGETQSVWNEQW